MFSLQSNIFDEYRIEGKDERNEIYLELNMEQLSRALKSTLNAQMVKIKLTKRQGACLSVEIVQVCDLISLHMGILLKLLPSSLPFPLSPFCLHLLRPPHFLHPAPPSPPLSYSPIFFSLFPISSLPSLSSSPLSTLPMPPIFLLFSPPYSPPSLFHLLLFLPPSLLLPPLPLSLPLAHYHWCSSHSAT